MDYDFWNNCWGRPTQPFHLIQPHHFLTHYFSTYFADQERVLLPLCGKTQDINFLAQQRINAVGIEFNPVAVESFFKDSELTPKITKTSVASHYSAPFVDIWCADFFELSQQEIGHFEVIFDRAALVALPSALREPYADQLQSFLSGSGKILLVTMGYVANEMSGPPFLVTPNELETLFADASINELDRVSILDSHPRWQELELSHLDEVLYEIQIR